MASETFAESKVKAIQDFAVEKNQLVPHDSPIRPEERTSYVFVAQTAQPNQFTETPARAHPLLGDEKPPETICDLCSISAPQQIFLVRCYHRRAAHGV